MDNKRFLVLLFFVSPFLSPAQSIDYSPKSLEKDLQKIIGKEDAALFKISIPDSIYNNILLDNGKIYRVISENELFGFTYIGRIFSCRAGGCGTEKSSETYGDDEDFEYFDYYIILNSALKVEQVRVYNYQATHGHEVGGRGWLKQFIGYNGDTKLELGRNIDSISGATISANAITYNVQEVTEYLALIKPMLSVVQAQ